MENIYVITFNNEAEVIQLGFCNGYVSADENFNATTKLFVKKFYALSGATSVAVKVCKYDENIASADAYPSQGKSAADAYPSRGRNVADAYCAIFKSDTSFPKGVIFVKKRHEATVYEKDAKGNVKYLGRIGVLGLSIEISEQQRNKIESLEARLSLNATLISQQDLSLKRQEAEILRLERSLEAERRGNAIYKPVESNLVVDVPEIFIPRAPKPPTPFQLLKTSQKPLVEELKERFAAREKILLRSEKKIQCDAEALDLLVKEIEGMAVYHRR